MLDQCVITCPTGAHCTADLDVVASGELVGQ